MTLGTCEDSLRRGHHTHTHALKQNIRLFVDHLGEHNRQQLPHRFAHALHRRRKQRRTDECWVGARGVQQPRTRLPVAAVQVAQYVRERRQVLVIRSVGQQVEAEAGGPLDLRQSAEPRVAHGLPHMLQASKSRGREAEEVAMNHLAVEQELVVVVADVVVDGRWDAAGDGLAARLVPPHVAPQLAQELAGDQRGAQLGARCTALIWRTHTY